MEPARLPFLLCVVDLQPLCAGRDRHASAAGANSRTDCERAKIYPRCHYRPIRLELGLSFDRESEPLNSTLGIGRWALGVRCSVFGVRCSMFGLAQRAKHVLSLRERIEVRAFERFVPHRLPARRDVSR
jgi:hypothetical protein